MGRRERGSGRRPASGDQLRPTPRERPRRAPAPPLFADPSPLSVRSRVAVALALTAIWLVLFAPVLGGRLTFVKGDAGRYTAFADFSRTRFASSGERTFWNPYVFIGLPSTAGLADPRPQWLPGPLLRMWDAVTRTEAGTPLWPPLAACLGGALAVAWLARALWACGPAAMTLAGGLWLLAPGLLVPLAFGHDAQCVTQALMPATLLAAHAVLRAQARSTMFAASLAFAGVLAAQALGGHPQFLVYTAIVLTPFAIERALALARPRRLAVLFGATGLAAALSAGAWLPTLRFAAHAQRADPGFAAREAGIFSLAVRDLLALAWPRIVGYGDSAYWGGMRGTDHSQVIGLLAVGLVVVGLLARRAARRAAALWGVVALAGMLLALGRNSPLSAWVQSIPVVGAFRTPATWLTLTVLAAALLAARGLEALVAIERPIRWGRWAIAALTFGLIVLLARPSVAEAWLAAARPAVEERIARGLVGQAAFERFAAAAPGAASQAAVDLGLQFLLVGGALAALALARRRGGGPGPALAGSAIAVLALVPVAVLVMPALRAATGPRATLAIQTAPPLAVAAATDPHYRAGWFDREWALSQRWSLANDWIGWRARQVLGLSGAVPGRFDQAARAGLLSERAFLRACAIRHVAFSDEAGGTVVGTWPDALPRAYAVARVSAARDDAGVVAALRDPAWDPATSAVAVATVDREFPGSSTLAIEWERDDPDRMALRLRAAAPAFLVVADAAFPGWRARLDERAIAIEPVDLLFRGVTIPAGEHRVQFDYEPEGWALARGIALTGWAVALGAAVALAVRRARIRPPYASWITLLVASVATSCAPRAALSDRNSADAPLTVAWDSTAAHAATQREWHSRGEYVYVKAIPEVISRSEPIYPIVAARRRITGTVIVHAFVLANGRVGATRVVKTIPELEGAAVACVKRWRFTPAVGDHGRPIAVWVSAPVTFKLP